ncbi:hypothetical protein ACLOJK_041655 [Asimina triloba]
MGSKSVEDLLEASAGVHFSGFHFDDLKLRNSVVEQPTTSVAESVNKEPFFIGVAGGAASGKTTVCDMIIEQLHDHRVVLVNQVRDLMNMKIFVDTDADVRLARRIRRDTVGKGRDISTVLDQYSKFVKPAFDDFILPTKKYADIIIPRGGDNHVAIDLIVQHIRTKLGQHDLCKIYPNLYVIQSTFQDQYILGWTSVKGYVVSHGESMENALRACCKGIKIGKILIHREGDNGQQLIYEKLPKDISDRHVLLLDPILGTGNSAVQAISLLIQKGVPESNIIFLNLISAPQGVHVVCKSFPRIKIVTSEIDIGLNEDYRVVPGMGEFGDRRVVLHLKYEVLIILVK